MALINCKECGKEISDTAKKCVNCGASTKKNKALMMIIKIIIITIFVAIIAIASCYLITINRSSYKYGKQTINILNSYKNNFISKKEVQNQLDAIYKEIDNIIDDFDNDSNEYHRLFMIKIKVLRTSINFLSNNVTITDINNSIDEIKEYMHFFS